MITGKAKFAGVIGWPIHHSRSPQLHGFWLQQYGIDGAYLPFSVSPDALGSAVLGLKALGAQGINVTVPHKQAVMPICDAIDETALAIGAVNTLIFREDSTIFGTNTDATGFIENLRSGAPDWDPVGGPAVVLGAGGASRAVIYALLQVGVPEIIIVNRTVETAQGLAREFSETSSAKLSSVGLGDCSHHLDAASLVVNTTSLGMVGQPPLDLDLDRLNPKAVATDIVYNPLMTPFLEAAAARHNTVVDGLGMLLHQAVPGFEAWFGTRPSVSEELRRTVLSDS